MRTALFLVLAAAAGCALAQQYRWTDDKGRVQYSDTPPPASVKGVQKKSLQGSVVETSGAGYDADQAAKKFPVTLYTSPNCEAPCQSSRDLLTKRGVPFKEVSVSDQASIAQLSRATGQTQVPAMMVGAQVQAGYSPEAWHAALDAATYPRTPPFSGTRPKPAANKPAAAAAVKLYTNSNCGPLCAEAKAFLAERGVKYEEVSVEDAAQVEELKRITGSQTVPVMIVGQTVQRGYDPVLYGSVLAAGGYPVPVKK